MSRLLVVCLLLPGPEREGERVKGQSEEELRVGGEPILSLGNTRVYVCVQIEGVI